MGFLKEVHGNQFINENLQIRVVSILHTSDCIEDTYKIHSNKLFAGKKMKSNVFSKNIE